MPPTVSVVMPFSRGEFLHEALASVFAQTRPPEQIVVVNDGAPPGDTAQLQQYEHALHIIHQSNRGPATARNVGIVAARGEWIAFLDDDDVWEPNRLSILCEYIGAHPECDVLHNAIRVVGADKVYRKSELTLRDFLVTYPSPAKPSSVMIRKSVLLESGLMNPALPLCEDYDCFLRVALRHRFHYVDLPLTQRRKHANNLSRRCFDVKYRVRNRILLLYGDLYQSNADRKLFAGQLNARFLAEAWKQHKWRAVGEILRLAHAQQVSRVSVVFQALKLLRERSSG